MALVKGSNISIEPCDGRGDFTLWQQWVKSLQDQKLTDDEWVVLRAKDKP